MKNRTTT